MLQVGSGRYHHPSRAARLGTPVRSRFRICRPTLSNSLLTWARALRRPRAWKGLCIAGWVRSLPPPQPGCPSGESVSLPVPYSSTDVVELFAYVGARFEVAARIEGFVYCRLDPVATTTPAGLPVWGPRSASGSVFVDPRLPDCLLTRLWQSCFQRKRDAAMHKYGTGSNSDRLLG